MAENVTWVKGIRSKNGPTRLVKPIDLAQDDDISQTIKSVVISALDSIPLQYNYAILGTYLNYYKDGSMYTPNHSHPKQHQLVISLGATRTLKIGQKEYKMANGDVILFGSSTHGVPIEPSVKEGRISIATFMIPVHNYF